MTYKIRPTLRYFARFTGEYGRLRAVVRYSITRKNITTPLIISKAQLSRLDSSGHINDPQSDEDFILLGRLREYTRYIWMTVNPLLDSGEFYDISSDELMARILATRESEEARREKILLDCDAAENAEEQELVIKYSNTDPPLQPEKLRAYIELTEHVKSILNTHSTNQQH